MTEPASTAVGFYHLWQRAGDEGGGPGAEPPHRAEWLCIHRHEGRWKDPVPPTTAACRWTWSSSPRTARELLRAKGTADHWTPLEQMWVAERAYRERGFWPWPNTARYCGLPLAALPLSGESGSPHGR